MASTVSCPTTRTAREKPRVTSHTFTAMPAAARMAAARTTAPSREDITLCSPCPTGAAIAPGWRWNGPCSYSVPSPPFGAVCESPDRRGRSVHFRVQQQHPFRHSTEGARRDRLLQGRAEQRRRLLGRHELV